MSKRASLLIKIGLLLTAAALCLAAYNLYEGVKAGNAAADAAAKIDAFIEESGEACVFDPDMEMPTVQLDGYEYIGILRIQALSLELPVMSEWSYSALKIAPCRYAGSAYSDDLVFTDALGNHLTKPTLYRAFKKAAAAVGRPDARFHDLRHSYAVAAIRSGDDIKTVQENLGHATYVLEGADEHTVVWDVTNPTRTRIIKGGTLKDGRLAKA